MGMIGSAARQAARIASMGFLGVDPERVKAERERREALQRAGVEAAGLFQPMAGPKRQVGVQNDAGEDITAAFGPQFEQGPGRARTQAEMAAGLAQIAARTPGFNAAQFRELAQMTRPNLTNVNGVMVDTYDPTNANREIVDVEKGQQRVYGADGRFMGVVDANGFIQSMANREEAKALGGAMGSFRDVPDGSGGSQLMTGRQFMGAQGGPGGLGYTPPAAQLSADKMRAESQAQGQIDLPNNMATAQSTLDIIGQLRDHPGRKLGTGATGVLPGIPGTAQKDFLTLLEQARGKTFLEAFGALKGGGQITEREGQAAQAAIARLDRTQSEEGFIQALNELEQIVRRGAERSQQRAGATPQPSQAEIAAELRRRGLLR